MDVEQYVRDYETDGESSIYDFGTIRNSLAIGGSALLGGAAGAAGGALVGGATGAVVDGALGAATGAAALGTLGGLMLGPAGAALGLGVGALGGGLAGAAIGAVEGGLLGGAAGGLAGGAATGIGAGLLLNSYAEGPNDARFVANDGGFDTGLWSMVTGEERGPTDLAGIAREVAEMGEINDLEIIGHGSPGHQYLEGFDRGDSGVGVGMTPEDEAALQELGQHMNGQIILEGCDIASGQGIAEMERLAALSGQTVSAGKSMQLPLPGIEGTQVTVGPNGVRTVDTSPLAQAYDYAAHYAEHYLYGTPL